MMRVTYRAVRRPLVVLKWLVGLHGVGRGGCCRGLRIHVEIREIRQGARLVPFGHFAVIRQTQETEISM